MPKIVIEADADGFEGIQAALEAYAEKLDGELNDTGSQLATNKEMREKVENRLANIGHVMERLGFIDKEAECRRMFIVATKEITERVAAIANDVGVAGCSWYVKVIPNEGTPFWVEWPIDIEVEKVVSE